MTDPAPRSAPDVALVLEGGGMRAAYTSGLVTVLVEEGIEVGWVGGISAGTTLLTNYLSRDLWRTRHSFTDFAADRRFGGWGHFVRGRGYFNAAYIYEESGLPDAALPFRWDDYLAHPAQACIGAFDADAGEQVWWGRDDMPTPADLFVRCRASSTMPMLMPPATIDGHLFVDGALGGGGGIPLDAAQAAGYRRFLVVLTRERSYTKPPLTRDRLLRRHFRDHPSVPEALATRPARYNATREEVFDLASSGAAYAFVPDRMPIGNGERSVPRLRAAYEAGLAQARRELPAIVDFLGV